MGSLIFILIVVYVALFLIKNKLVIRFDTLFRKGFKKHKDNYGVYCFCGKQGVGKTYSVADFLSEIIKPEQKVITNVKSLAKSNPDTYIYKKDFKDIQAMVDELGESVNKRNKYIIFFDEIFTLVEKGKLDKSMLAWLSQMRKKGIIFITTAQEWLEINVTFRRYVRYQVQCEMFNIPFFDTALSYNTIKNAYEMKWDKDENEYVCPVIKSTLKKCSKAIADSYDTFEVIES